MFGFGERATQSSTPFEIGKLRHKYGRDFARVVSNRINDRTLSSFERSRWRAIAEQI